ncbi:MAG: nucleotidyl transferase AbiEii/AbiGii toxin family protein [Planctomycetaceae bacterium]|jgi:hypothetical protein|nr:nucleotidyl transferase AbiEii/AbiGii toxin family protein [Planctomycetaceae bacterium]
MPQIDDEKTVEEFYWDCVRKMSPMEKVRRAIGLNISVCTMVKNQLCNNQLLSDEMTLRFAVAKRFYWNEPNILTLLNEAEKNITNNNKTTISMNNNELLMDLDKTTEKVITILEEMRYPFAVTGGLASITYGDPRTTRDIDVILEIKPSEINVAKIFFEKFDNDFIFSLKGCREAIEKQTIFQAIDKETMFKVDFHLSDIVSGSCARRRNVQILTGRVVPMVTPEDAILSKLVWIKLGSERSRKDIIAMLRIQTNLDNKYLETTAEKLGVIEILKELQIIADNYDSNIIL